MTIAALFASRGAWMLLPFAVIEAAALSVAFIVYSRHATDYERIVVEPGVLLVERTTGGRLARLECESAWVRVAYAGSRSEPIRLIAGGSEVVVGRFVPDESKEELVRELRASFAGWRVRREQNINDSVW